ncbi:hypothetical protein DPEC_G00308580 [Dallia pectoralis]|uniref:Uncharacterized protein n=1 Tax=Dallia pectoralis TaxID=75939 RepID=A0ACC2FEQ7_DALPE|nr:hypothetical protein DPEC_G00308580 [Dallia pectoralis]
MAYSVSFNLNPVVDPELGSLQSTDTGQNSLTTEHRTETTPEGDIGSPETLEIKVISKEDEQISDVREPAPERGLQDCESTQTSPLVRNHWSATTLKVLSSMPSRSIGQQSHLGMVSRCTIRRTQLSRHRRQTTDSSLSSRRVVRGNEDAAEEDTKTQELVNNLKTLSTVGQVRVLRSTPLSLAEKSKLRKLAHCDKVGQSLLSSEVSFWRNIKRASHQSLFAILSFFGSLRFWQVPLKRLGGRFGTGVLSYFLLLRTLLFFNIIPSFINGIFLVLPQAIHPPRRDTHARTLNFTGLELVTATGFLSDSVMFYGHYTNSTIDRGCGLVVKVHDGDTPPRSACGGASEPQMMAYSMPLAYTFSVGVVCFITCVALLYSMSKSFGLCFQVLSSHENLASKIFCFWDFKVTRKTSVRLQSENISTQLKELLSKGNCREDTGDRLHKLCGIVVCPLAWSLCLGATFFFALGVHYTAKYLPPCNYTTDHGPVNKDIYAGEARLLVLPAVVSCGNLLLPGLFNVVSFIENYSSPRLCFFVAIFRNFLLKICILGVLCNHWFGKVAVEPARYGVQCWESCLGQEMYRFLLMDFIFTVLYMVVGESILKVFCQVVLRRNRQPLFDIARNVLELIYGQTLTWLGVFFAPLLPTVQIFRLLVLFHMKRNSLLMNCQVSGKLWRASHLITIFISLLCFSSFLGASVFVTFAVWTIKPSTGCGPFRNLPTMLHSTKQWAHELAKANPKLAWLDWVQGNMVENPLFWFLVSVVLQTVIYIQTQVLDGQKRIMILLQEQRQNEGKDITFLITKLQAAHEGGASTASIQASDTGQ